MCQQGRFSLKTFSVIIIVENPIDTLEMLRENAKILLFDEKKPNNMLSGVGI